MQSRGLLPIRRNGASDSSRSNVVPRSNGDVVRNKRSTITQQATDTFVEESHRYGYERNSRIATDRRPTTSKTIYPGESSSVNGNYEYRRMDLEPRRSKRQDRFMNREELNNSWRDNTSRDYSRIHNITKPILRNGLGYERYYDRPYYSTLPRRNRTINFKDLPYDSMSHRRGYPKSLQDLTALEMDDRVHDTDVSSFLLSNNRVSWRDDRPIDGRRRRRHRQDELVEDNYLRLYRNLSKLEKYPQGGRYEPGQVHYERECRTFGKDTVAFIYYKTCYL